MAKAKDRCANCGHLAAWHVLEPGHQRFGECEQPDCPGCPCPGYKAPQPEAVTTRVESVKPFQVRASCGHIVTRPMREATAGVPYTPETILEAPNGRACPACEAEPPDTCDRCNGPLVNRIAVDHSIYCSQACADGEPTYCSCVPPVHDGACAFAGERVAVTPVSFDLAPGVTIAFGVKRGGA